MIICTHVHMCMSTHTYTYTRIRIHIHVYIYKYTFAGCKPRFFNALIVILKPVHVIPGDTIVFKDEVPRELYFVYQGALRVVHARDLHPSVCCSTIF